MTTATLADPTVQAIVIDSCGDACGYGSRATGSARSESDLDLLVGPDRNLKPRQPQG